MPVEFERGSLRLSGTPLWLDARKKSPLSFVSHAHSDHIARHERVFATAATLRIMQHRLGSIAQPHVAEYGAPVELDGLRLEVFPAGHVLGSAQLRFTRADGHRVVYTGDVSLGPSLTAERAEIVSCDTLVIESTFGHPRYAFPPREQVYDQVAAWAKRELARGIRPILFAYSLGKSQETIAQLAQRGLSLCAHPSIHDIAALYTELGVPVHARKYDGTFEAGEVGIFPPFGRSLSVRKLEGKSTAVLTGWALEPWGARRSGADLAFPVSDHADYPSLVEYAKASGAREIITLHGFADELAAGLRKLGLFARSASKAVQMELSLAQ